MGLGVKCAVFMAKNKVRKSILKKVLEVLRKIGKLNSYNSMTAG